jgi:hypothetical protein
MYAHFLRAYDDVAPIIRRSHRSVVASGRLNWGGRDPEQWTLRLLRLAHAPVQRGESESWEDHTAWRHDYPPFLSPHRSCHAHPFGRLHRLHRLQRFRHWLGSLWVNPTFLSIQCAHVIHVSANKAFVFLLDFPVGGTDHNTSNRVQHFYMSGAPSTRLLPSGSLYEYCHVAYCRYVRVLAFLGIRVRDLAWGTCER